MMIEISEIKKQKTGYAVYTENAVYIIDGEYLHVYDLEKGSAFENTLLEELHEKTRLKKAYQRACYLLDSKDYSYQMMYQKLMQTYHDEKLCHDVLEKLQAYGMIDDKRYTEKLAVYLAERKKYGIHRIRQEMRYRGLDRNLIEDALAMPELLEMTEQNLPVVLERKYARDLTDPDDRKAIEKVIAGMLRLGYAYTYIRYAIADYFAQQEENWDE